MSKKISGGKKILIVEDDASIVDIYSTVLSGAGFDVTTAADGQEGLRKALANKPNLILLDILMPVMDGLQMLEKLRENGEYGAKAAVVMLTNLSAGDEEIIKKIAEAKPLSYIVKSSVTPEEMVQKVKEYLKK